MNPRADNSGLKRPARVSSVTRGADIHAAGANGSKVHARDIDQLHAGRVCLPQYPPQTAVRERLFQERDFGRQQSRWQTESRSCRRWRFASSLLRSEEPATSFGSNRKPTLSESALDGFKSALPPARQMGTANSPLRAGSAIGIGASTVRHVEVEERRRAEALGKRRAQGQRRCRPPDQRVLRIEASGRRPSSRRNDRRAPSARSCTAGTLRRFTQQRQPQLAKRSNNGALVRAGDVCRRPAMS